MTAVEVQRFAPIWILHQHEGMDGSSIKTRGSIVLALTATQLDQRQSRSATGDQSWNGQCLIRLVQDGETVSPLAVPLDRIAQPIADMVVLVEGQGARLRRRQLPLVDIDLRIRFADERAAYAFQRCHGGQAVSVGEVEAAKLAAGDGANTTALRAKSLWKIRPDLHPGDIR